MLAGGITHLEEVQAPNSTVDWQEAMTTRECNTLKKQKAVDALIDQGEKIKASIRVKVEHPLQVIKCQFGYRKTRLRGLAKNTAQRITLFVDGDETNHSGGVGTRAAAAWTKAKNKIPVEPQKGLRFVKFANPRNGVCTSPLASAWVNPRVLGDFSVDTY